MGTSKFFLQNKIKVGIQVSLYIILQQTFLKVGSNANWNAKKDTRVFKDFLLLNIFKFRTLIFQKDHFRQKNICGYQLYQEVLLKGHNESKSQRP